MSRHRVQNRDRVIELYLKGLDSSIISTRVGLSGNQVRGIIRTYKKKQGANNERV